MWLVMWFVCPIGCVKLPSLPEGEITAIEVHRANPYIELGISIVGGNETPLINIVIQEVYRDGVIARDGRLLAGDQILQARALVTSGNIKDVLLPSCRSKPSLQSVLASFSSWFWFWPKALPFWFTLVTSRVGGDWAELKGGWMSHFHLSDDQTHNSKWMLMFLCLMDINRQLLANTPIMATL